MENNEETWMQRVHELKLALDMEKSLRLDSQAENERLVAELTESKSHVDTVKLSLENEIRSLKDKIINLTNEYETDKLSHSEKIRELEEELKSVKIEKPMDNHENEYKKLMNDLMHEKQSRHDLEEEFSRLKEAMVDMEMEKSQLEQKLKDSMQHCEEMREALDVKKENLVETLAALKEAQEEKAMLTSEVDILKAGPIGDLERGNSLFKEVEDNRKKLAFAYNTLKNKYVTIKNIISVKNQEISRLKVEVASLKSRDIGIDGALQKSKSQFYESLKKRIQELETSVHMMEKWKESPEIVTISESEVSNLQWIHSIVNQARSDTRKALADYQKLSSDQMAKAVALRNTELELFNLKSEMLRKAGIIEKLELEIAELKSEAKENITQSKAIQDDSALSVRNTNKTVRFADDELEETQCNGRNN